MVRPTKRTKNNKPCADLDIAAAKLRPSKVTLRALQTAYDHFNRELFGGTLPRCLITLQGLNKRSFGHCLSRWNRDGRAIHEIGINPLHFAYDPMRETLATLGHEMAHLWQHQFGTPGRGNYHNREWVAKMKEIGLYPSATNAAGGKEAGPRVA
jgi:hypothetical protein